MTTARKHLRSQRGFTLVEAIIVMVLTGVLAGVMVLFIRQPVQNYVDAAGRAGLTDTADLALRRMARELRSALPNSIRTTFNNGVWYVQFIPVRSGGQYLAVEDSTTGGIPLSFTSMSATQFDVVGPMPDVVPGDIIAIYNLGNEIIDDAYYVQEAPPTNTNQVNRQQVSAVSGTGLRWQTTPSFRRTCHQRTHAEHLARTSLPRDRPPLAGNAQALLELRLPGGPDGPIHASQYAECLDGCQCACLPLQRNAKWQTSTPR
jgi:prepilin-type N-terminal cleavage/methylation domain-containing protein